MRKRASELQIQIDDVYACLGQCGGCILSASERKGSTPDMSSETLELAVQRLKDHAAASAPLHRVNVTYGIADHLLMNDDYIIDLYRKGADIIRAGNPTDRAHSGVFFTTSLIGRADDIIARLRRLHAAADPDVPLLPLVVLDPRLMMAEKFGPKWRDMVIAAKSLFGEIDLSINLSHEAIKQMTPAELIEFAETNAFNEVTVNWVPTLLNAHKTLVDIPATEAWLVEFDNLTRSKPHLGTSFRPVIRRTIDALMCSIDGNLPRASQVIQDIVPETIAKSIEIDHLGFLLPKLEAIGDTAHSERFGLKALGHLSDGSIQDLLTSSLPGVMRKILFLHSHGACAECPVSGICAATGFHVATHVGRLTNGQEAGDRCPHVARTLIERIFNELVIDDSKRLAS